MHSTLKVDLLIDRTSLSFDMIVDESIPHYLVLNQQALKQFNISQPLQSQFLFRSKVGIRLESQKEYFQVEGFIYQQNSHNSIGSKTINLFNKSSNMGSNKIDNLNNSLNNNILKQSLFNTRPQKNLLFKDIASKIEEINLNQKCQLFNSQSINNASQQNTLRDITTSITNKNQSLISLNQASSFFDQIKQRSRKQIFQDYSQNQKALSFFKSLDVDQTDKNQKAINQNQLSKVNLRGQIQDLKQKIVNIFEKYECSYKSEKENYQELKKDFEFVQSQFNKMIHKNRRNLSNNTYQTGESQNITQQNDILCLLQQIMQKMNRLDFKPKANDKIEFYRLALSMKRSKNKLIAELYESAMEKEVKREEWENFITNNN